jgi:hypothetical protein
MLIFTCGSVAVRGNGQITEKNARDTTARKTAQSQVSAVPWDNKNENLQP